MTETYNETPECPRCGGKRFRDIQEFRDRPSMDDDIPYITWRTFFRCCDCGCRFKDETIYRWESSIVTILGEDDGDD